MKTLSYVLFVIMLSATILGEELEIMVPQVTVIPRSEADKESKEEHPSESVMIEIVNTSVDLNPDVHRTIVTRKNQERLGLSGINIAATNNGFRVDVKIVISGRPLLDDVDHVYLLEKERHSVRWFLPLAHSVVTNGTESASGKVIHFSLPSESATNVHVLVACKDRRVGATPPLPAEFMLSAAYEHVYDIRLASFIHLRQHTFVPQTNTTIKVTSDSLEPTLE